MMAVTIFAFEEAIFKAPIVQKTSILFYPIWDTLF